ncbi:energy transducer TonB [Ferruginibacter sp. SUN106]|uniref:energy transducer TonB n=1 Tax=Ferruginibacter sp. SUN106 TaxID=2978348 RepID=UPI003D36BA4B
MTNKSFFSLRLWSTAIILGTTILSCNSDDYNKSASTTPEDTTSSTVATPSAAAPDTSKMIGMDSTANNKTGMAKPNPAKKGLKGKVTILPPPAAVAGAKMEVDNAGVYTNTEVFPSYPGGNKELQKFFNKNLEYPEDASANGVEGTVELSFVVDETGKLTSPQVVGQPLGYGLETEALRVINKMPVWNPGQLKGKNVKTRFTLPVKFVLE